ncbi:1,4-beta-xylanase [Georgenia wutianyii]|uniref:Beta-xylanase n=1 Tax=Georgenia wutianyii TaxID=2585135 RepID=A0ABX5VKI2_9MICO|nr:endo-1,4-beta-xylanase [Georgenia wutianyii]QDB78952.1 1,4-beta-xylanase [Georgenia wutianyii]
MTVTSAADASLRHRYAEAFLTVRRGDGAPLADTEVTVAQTRHAFSFGNIGFDLVAHANGETEADPDSPFGGAPPASGEHLAALWLDLFNTATLPFYWAGFEPRRGTPDTTRLLRAARWFAERGVTVKGHPLAWHTLAPDWLLDVPTDEVETLLRERIRREVSDFAGVVDVWDAINEVVIMPVFSNEERRNAITRLCWERGRIPTVRLAFEEARAANPSATLLLNDFNLSPAFECLVEGVLEAGIRVDAIGLQSHMHQGYWGEERTLETLDRFARFGLPLHLTESTLLSGDLMPADVVDLNDHQVESWPTTPEGEERQAQEIVRHYRTLVSHPAVEAVTYWGLTDEGSWLGAPVGLVRADGSTKPSFDALHGLLKDEWWLAPTTLRTDAEGRVSVRGFRGEYAVSASGARAAFTLDRDGDVEVTLPAS